MSSTGSRPHTSAPKRTIARSWRTAWQPSILNQRYTEIIRQADAPFLSASTGTGEFVRPVEIASLGVQTEEDKALPGLEAALAEIERARQHGFTEAELARAKAELLRGYKSSYDERNNIENDAFAQAYLDNFLTGAIPIGVTDSYSLAQELLPTITLAEVNDRVATLYAPDNRAVLLVAPEKGRRHPARRGRLDRSPGATRRSSSTNPTPPARSAAS